MKNEYIDDMEYIQNVFCISCVGLAHLLGKPRSDIYVYGEGKEPSETTKLDLKRLVQIAKIFEKSDIERIGYFMYREIKDGKTLIEIIKENIYTLFIDLDSILTTVKEVSKREAEERRKPKGSGKTLRSLSDVFGEYSTPVYIENDND